MTEFTKEERELANWLQYAHYRNLEVGKDKAWLLLARELLKNDKEVRG